MESATLDPKPPQKKTKQIVMAARSRPRAGLAKELEPESHEESLCWRKVQNELKNLHTLSIKVDNLGNRIAMEETRLFGGDYSKFLMHLSG